ncbi:MULTISPECIES: hypothetical protein [Halomonadaceae]|uniref:Uncharacterized protein n=1 Tax=Modicisalibacter tunisiensis TaxID=390637 RepID=A0ABS7WZE8_9GAMM|nr:MULTISPECIES: hypothetical protein [Halomonadaceae]MBZ9539081.1 hypothetical protein [Modicisalibacter tunisiensis]MBZ9567519.1 hypothetical protein [Modicisalibacter tunisiensis]MCJ8285849.1 hypothetical protein [Halomonas sp.]NQY70403.1 hypothetical protein [Halomonas sp.]
MNTNIKWLDTWRARVARVKRGVGLVISGLLLVVGILLSVALLPELPGLVSGTITGDGEAARTLFVCVAGIAVCVLQWLWRATIYPELRRDPPQKETS